MLIDGVVAVEEARRGDEPDRVRGHVQAAAVREAVWSAALPWGPFRGGPQMLGRPSTYSEVTDARTSAARMPVNGRRRSRTVRRCRVDQPLGHRAQELLVDALHRHVGLEPAPGLGPVQARDPLGVGQQARAASTGPGGRSTARGRRRPHGAARAPGSSENRLRRIHSGIRTAVKGWVHSASPGRCRRSPHRGGGTRCRGAGRCAGGIAGCRPPPTARRRRGSASTPHPQQLPRRRPAVEGRRRGRARDVSTSDRTQATTSSGASGKVGTPVASTVSAWSASTCCTRPYPSDHRHPVGHGRRLPRRATSAGRGPRSPASRGGGRRRGAWRRHPGRGRSTTWTSPASKACGRCVLLDPDATGIRLDAGDDRPEPHPVAHDRCGGPRPDRLEGRHQPRLEVRRASAGSPSGPGGQPRARRSASHSTASA